jgi:hypothetical protein
MCVCTYGADIDHANNHTSPPPLTSKECLAPPLGSKATRGSCVRLSADVLDYLSLVLIKWGSLHIAHRPLCPINAKLDPRIFPTADNPSYRLLICIAKLRHVTNNIQEIHTCTNPSRLFSQTFFNMKSSILNYTSTEGSLALLASC